MHTQILFLDSFANIVLYIDDAAQVKQLLGELTGRDTFPNVFVNGFSIGGANELGHMHKNGRLREILKDNHLI